MTSILLKLARPSDERGATMAEYAILVAAIAIVVILAARALGVSVSTKLDASATSIGTL